MGAARLTEDDLWSLFDLTTQSRQGLETALNRVAEFFEASGASVFLGDVDGVFRLQAKTGRLAAMPYTATVERGVGLAGQVLAKGEARIVQGRKLDDLAPTDETRPVVASALVVPLIDPDRRAMGVLNLSRGPEEPRFDELDLAQARALAAHLALSVLNARLLEQTRAALDAAHRSAETLRGVLDSVGAAVSVRDVWGEEVDHNREADGIWGTLEAATGFNEFLTGIKEEPLSPAEKRTGRAYSFDGARAWSLTAVGLTDGGSVLTVIEVTDALRAQMEMGRVKRLAEIGQMSAAIAHEIRNPLTGIRSAAQMLRQDPSLADELGLVIEEEVLRLNQLCEDFLDFARPIQLALKPVDLENLALRVVRLLTPEFEADEKELRLTVLQAGASTLLDERRVEQVLLNLVRNAREASAPGQPVELVVTDRGFQVRDRGCGIEGDSLSQLGTPFFTTKPHGTGLGLSTVRKIVDAHGAHLRVESQPGMGSTFSIEWMEHSA